MGCLSGVPELGKALTALKHRAERAAAAAARRTADEVQTTAQVLLSTRSHPPGTPTPSSPGSPPARIGGHLADTIRVTGPMGGPARVGPTAVYGRIQELGGVAGRGHRTRLPPRPYMAPAWRLTRPRVGRITRESWDRTH